ncbi:F-box domain-containing protein [Favolaschia claudopus]|uniref:F-box domain-containing protein n=1 Tax=Favolaschia claudopus TaxID=2862362 RepID=A0AAW0BFM8_9AGAR
MPTGSGTESIPRCSACGAIHMSPGFIEPSLGTTHHRLLNSNEPPVESETAFIRDLVSKSDHNLAIIDAEISTLQTRIGTLRAQRASLLDFRRRTRSVTSLLRRMPPELLREIFHWSMPRLKSRAVDIQRSPWLLTHVCSQWRTVALAMPSLWSLFYLQYSALDDAQPAYSLPLVELQLQRAQKLKIHFYGNSALHSQPQTAIFRLLADHCTRWEELSLGLTPDIAPLLNDLRDRIPYLQKLWIQWTSREDQGATHSIDCFQMAPALHDVGIYYGFNFVEVPLPAHQLTRYESDCGIEQHLRMLKMAPNLVEAHVDIDWAPASDIRHEEIEMLHLRRLYVSNPKFLPFLRVPALEELSLEILDDYDEDDKRVPSYLFSLLDRSSCSLRRLCVRGFAADEINTLLLQVPSITELLIIGQFATELDRSVASLHVPNRNPTDSKPMAPQLRRICFACEEEIPMNYVEYAEMVKSRWKMHARALEEAALLVENGPKLDAVTTSILRSPSLEGLRFLLLEGPVATEEIKRWYFRTTWN